MCQGGMCHYHYVLVKMLFKVLYGPTITMLYCIAVFFQRENFSLIFCGLAAIRNEPPQNTQFS